MKIVILDDYVGAALRLADWAGLGDVSVFTETISDSDLRDHLLPFEVISLMRERTPISAELIAALPNLRLIVTSGSRNASIDIMAPRAACVTVCGTESRKTTTSELATLMMLALNRRLLPEVASLHTDGWQGGLGRDVAGLTLGLIGLGNIGAQMVTIGKALGMGVVAWSPNLTDARCAALGVGRMENLPDLMARADVASVHMVLSDRSRGLVDAKVFASARHGQVFINTSRGALVDTSALLDGLRVRRPAMAGVDVFDVEPLPLDDPMRDVDLIASGRLLLTPHLGYATEATFRLFYTQTVDAIRAYQAGTPIREL